jgi:hypothetical protein
MHRRYTGTLLTLLLLVFLGCDALEDEGGTVTLTGLVLDTAEEPVSGAFIHIQPVDAVVETDGIGRYALAAEVDSSMQLSLTVTKDGFASATTPVYAVANRTIQVPTIRLQQVSGEAPESGDASNILLLEQSAQSIGVKESGSQEVANITFQLADSMGRPVVVDHAAEVHFSFGVHPDGGEFIHPTRATTDNKGRATVNLSSGTKAGAVQIIAQTEVDGHLVRSKPVSVAIHGGLPDQAHFSLGPESFNYPGLLAYGLRNPVSVVVGDKYANPVKPGTSIYFTTDHAVIEGSVTTDSDGQGTVDFISANPLPPRGIAVITASTADENQADVVARIPMLMTGFPYVRFADPPPVFAELGRTYEVTIDDVNGNPLAEETSITVEAQGTKVKAVGHTDVRLGRTGFLDANGDGDIFDYEDVMRGPGITQFAFRAVADLEAPGEGAPALEAIVITVSGPNGELKLALTPEDVMALTREAVIDYDLDGRPLVRLAK